MARQGITYAQLVAKLAAIGVQGDERNARNKVDHGKFTAGYRSAISALMGLSMAHWCVCSIMPIP